MATRRKFDAASDVAAKLLRKTASAADLIPSLKTLAGVALSISKTAERFRANKTEWKELGAHIQDVAATVVQLPARVDQLQGEHIPGIDSFLSVLNEVAEKILFEQAQRRRKRFGPFLQDLELIENLKVRIDNAIRILQLQISTTAMINATKNRELEESNSKALSALIQDQASVIAKVDLVESKSLDITQNAALEKLRRIQGASWDVSRVCLANTRVKIVGDIMKRIYSFNEPDTRGEAPHTTPSKGAQIMMLTAVAGAGKTTIAHTVSKQCYKKGILASTFFFDRETQGRNNPDALFSTIAADISRLDRRLAQRIAAAIEDDASLPSAPISRQFEELILAPCRDFSPLGPLVIVIDGLDEAWDQTLLDILRNGIPRLPDSFRVVLTSRMRPELCSLARKPYVSRIELDIAAQENRDDAAVFTIHQLARLAEERDLGENWPGKTLRDAFLEKSGGLFLWVATVTEYLSNRDDPTLELRELLNSVDLPNTTAEARMDGLYTTILNSFDWSDKRFVSGYTRVMGTAIASKIPLTISAMRNLHEVHPQDHLASDFSLQKLSPLLVGMDASEHSSRPVRVLHQSLRDFLVFRACSKFRISETEHNQRLAHLCLDIMNRGLASTHSFAGFITRDNLQGIPSPKCSEVSEALLYASQFWLDHFDHMGPNLSANEALTKFLNENTTPWLEILALFGHCRGLASVRNWMKEHNQQELSAEPRCQEVYTKACLSITTRLAHEDRREEALEMAEEAVALYRKLHGDDPDGHICGLASALNHNFNRLYELGHQEHGLPIMQESLQLRRLRIMQRPDNDQHALDLAVALNDYSLSLTALGSHSEALSTIEEAVKLRRELALKQPAEYTHKLANSLNNHSLCLSHVNRHEEALPVMQEAIKLRRQLAGNDPDFSVANLAQSLNNLSVCLYELERHSEALAAIEESVPLYRRLATARPIYNSDLGMSLNNLVRSSASVGKHRDAIRYGKEAIEIARRLCAQRPDATNADLAMYLANYSESLTALKLYEDALVHLQETIALRKQLVEIRPRVFNERLAFSLSSLSSLLKLMGGDGEFIAASSETAGRP